MVVACGSYGNSEQILILIDSLNYSREEKLELNIILGMLAGRKQVFACVGGNRSVVVLAAAVYALKGLFVQQANKTVPLGDLLHNFHHQLVVVGGDV